MARFDVSKITAVISGLLNERLGDWIFIVVAGLVYWYAEGIEPVQRMFRLDDPNIQYPKAKKEHVSSELCIVLVFVIPLLIVSLTPVLFVGRRNRLALIHATVLGLISTFVIDGAVVDILKVWLGRPRPDLLDRCRPAPGTPTDQYVTSEVCTTKKTHSLNEGFKSTPSGHTATSFSCMVFFCLWLNGQTLALRPRSGLVKPALSFLPLLLAFYIAISRTEDNRHHLLDVILGGIIGSTFGWALYRRYFPAINSPKSYIPYLDAEEEEANPEPLLGSDNV